MRGSFQSKEQLLDLVRPVQVHGRYRGGTFPIPLEAPATSFRGFTIEAMTLRQAPWQKDDAVPNPQALEFSWLCQSEPSLDPSLFRLHEKNLGFRFRFIVEYCGEGSDSLEKTGSTRLCPDSTGMRLLLALKRSSQLSRKALCKRQDYLLLGS